MTATDFTDRFDVLELDPDVFDTSTGRFSVIADLRANDSQSNHDLTDLIKAALAAGGDDVPLFDGPVTFDPEISAFFAYVTTKADADRLIGFIVYVLGWTPETRVEIPGTFTATYDQGRITALTFLPSGSDAGYFGPPARVIEGDDNLDVTDTDGPFWKAVQSALAEGTPINWEE
jgi:hypothetical protein